MSMFVTPEPIFLPEITLAIAGSMDTTSGKRGVNDMMGLLTLVFLAALVGLIKPYVRNLTRKHFGGIAIAAFIGMMIVVPKQPDDQTATATPKTDTKTVAGPVEANAVKTTAIDPIEAAPQSNWSYDESEDAMRGSKTRYARLTSDNEVDLDFPYGEQYGKIMIRRDPESGLNVMFGVGKGQILCNSFTNTTVSVKFDDGPIQKMGCTDASDGSSETVFFTNENRVLSGLKKAKKTVVEAEFYQQGRRQFVFQTTGLDWK